MKYERRVPLSTKAAVTLWAFIILSGLIVAVKIVSTAVAAITALAFWLGLTAVCVGSVWILHNKFETWLDDRADRKEEASGNAS